MNNLRNLAVMGLIASVSLYAMDDIALQPKEAKETIEKLMAETSVAEQERKAAFLEGVRESADRLFGAVGRPCECDEDEAIPSCNDDMKEDYDASLQWQK